jgi:hypothetical protein
MAHRFSAKDTCINRELAKTIRDRASDARHARLRSEWKDHNALRSFKPMMLVFPEGSWVELLPESTLCCEGKDARQVELSFRSRLYTAEHFQDDTVLEAEWVEPKVFSDTGWGLEVRRTEAPTARGAWHYQQTLAGVETLRKMHHPDLVYDEKESNRNHEAMQELLGDILTIKHVGTRHFSYHLMAQYAYWRGLEDVMVDMAGNRDFVHQVMHFLVEGHQQMLVQYQQANLLSLNNDGAYNNSGGVSYSDELPARRFDGLHVRPCDIWANSESQELAQVSPRMHREFALPYEKTLLEPFGLTGYGCCEDLSRKMADVLTIPHIRRISVAPSADVERSAAALGGKAIFSWKPQPSHLVGDFDQEMIRAYIRRTLEISRRYGCILEMILKDTHTCEQHPERFDRWTHIAREEIEAGE